VLLMAMERLDKICAALIAHGRPPMTPAAVVYRATLPGERVVLGTLDEIADAAQQTNIGPPAVVVIGDVVDIADQATRASASTD
jgi:uroporphyrin-III C-methyltransferase/precorrin-2 dehydrogenase/sirohydrochlorin ferrochelatase